jgi:peptidoglycan pentaglycine glycine transferase (the first glycine)
VLLNRDLLLVWQVITIMSNLKLIEIKKLEDLNSFVGAQPHAELLQSWAWGEFQEKVGVKVLRLGVEDGGKLVAVASLIKRSSPLGMNYFYCPRGPIVNYKLSIINEKLFDFLLSEIKKIANKEKVIFLRIEPIDKINNSSFIINNSLDVQVSKTIMLDLTKSEEELLAAMHQKTRYNIRLAEKKGVAIKESPLSRGVAEGRGVSDDEFEKFWSLMSATVNRDGFRLHEKEYYKKMLSTENIKLFFADYQNKIICAGIFSFFGDTAVYLHGASANENRELMAPHLLQWELIKKAKASGCKYYDFFGIDEKKWPGVTRFKRGFSGEEMNYPGTFDVIFEKTKYKVYKFLRTIRRLIKF